MEVRRPQAALGLAVILGLCVAAIAWLGSGHELRPGDPAPATWRGADLSAPVVAWVVRGQDCLSCYTPAYELRRMRAEHGDRLTLWVVATKDPENFAGQFLRHERIDAVHVSLSDAAYREAFGRTRLPVLLVSLRDTIRGLWRPRPDGAGDGGRPKPTLREMVARVMARSETRD